MAGARVLRQVHRRLATRRGATVATALAVLAFAIVSVSVGACRTTSRIPSSDASVGPEPEMRVRLTRSAEQVSLDADGPITLTALGSPNAPLVRVTPPVALRVEEGGIVAVEMATKSRPMERVVPVHGAEVVVIDGPGSPVRIDGTPHAGGLEAIARPSAERPGVDIVESIPIEAYIAGVLTSELYATWAPATYEAQAIAARSYALHERGRRMRLGDHFHVESTTQDQAYAGDRATPQAKRAAESTRGMVLTFRDHILRAYYSSTCGGRAGSARDTWPVGPGFGFNLDAPIQAHERDCGCSFSPRHSWSVARTRAELAARFSAWGRENGHPIRRLDSVRAVEVARRNTVGRPASYAVTDAKGVVFTLSAEELRLACNTAATGQPEIDGRTRVLSGDIVVLIKGEDATIEGRGFGHGVGMCQFGAEGMARDGRRADEIVLHYYRGALLERAY